MGSKICKKQLVAKLKLNKIRLNCEISELPPICP